MKTTRITAGVVAWVCWTGAVAAETTPSSLATAPTGPGGSADVAPVTAPEPIAHTDEHKDDVLLQSNVALGGYGGPDTRLTTVLSQPALLVGAQANWLANHQYVFGLAGYGLATRHDAPEEMRIEGNPSMLGLVYGGIRVGIVANPTRLFHLTISALAGPGSLTGISRVPTRAEFEVGYERRLGHAESFFVLEPEVAAEMNATTFMRIALGASYRYVTGVDHPGLSSANMSSPSASLAFKFGVF